MPEIPQVSVPVLLTPVPVLLTPKKKTNGEIEIKINVGEMDQVFSFQSPSMLGNLSGNLLTPNGMKEYLRNMLREKFGRVEDAIR